MSNKVALITGITGQDGAPSTYADIAEFTENTGFTPKTEIEDGISSFVIWYKSFVSATLKSEVSKK